MVSNLGFELGVDFGDFGLEFDDGVRQVVLRCHAADEFVVEGAGHRFRLAVFDAGAL